MLLRTGLFFYRGEDHVRCRVSGSEILYGITTCSPDGLGVFAQGPRKQLNGLGEGNVALDSAGEIRAGVNGRRSDHARTINERVRRGAPPLRLAPRAFHAAVWSSEGRGTACRQ